MAFLPDGRSLLATREAAWDDLKDEAKGAYRSMWKLARDPGAIDLLRAELQSAAIAADAASQLRGFRAIEVTNAGLEDLKHLKNLRTLGLRQSKVTASAVKKLQEALPDCQIFGGGGD